MGSYRGRLGYLARALSLGILTGIIFGALYSLIKTFIGSGYLYFTEKWPALPGNLLLFSIFCGLGGLIFGSIMSLISFFTKKQPGPKKLILVFISCFLSFSCAYSIDWWLSNIFFGYRHFLPHSLADFLLFFYALILIPAIYFLLRTLLKAKMFLRLCIIGILMFSVLAGEWTAFGFIERGFNFDKDRSAFVKGEDLNVILILVDALVPQKVGCYGQVKDLTPNIDKLAAKGVVFLDTISQSNWTHASIPSLFTATYPIVHGVTGENKKLSGSIATVAEIFQDNGYSTCAFMTNPWVARQFGLGQGFDFYVDLIERDSSRWYDLYYKVGTELGILETPPHSYPTAELLTDEAISWIEKFQKKRFFLYLHYMDVHGPFVRHDLSDTDFVYQEEADLVQSEKTPVSMYESQVLHVDQHIGLLVERLKELALDKKTMIIITSDHGHYLDQQGDTQSRETMYEYAIRIPLLLTLPGVFPSGLRIERQAQEIDIAPTALSALGLEPDVNMQGVDLQDVIAYDEEGSEERYVFSEVGPTYMVTGSHLIAVRRFPWKYIYDIWNQRGELYHLNNDPQEQNNLIYKMPEVARIYHREMLDYVLEGLELSEKISSGDDSATIEIDNATEQRLKSLGYLQ